MWYLVFLNATAHALITAWTRVHIAKWGRVAEYSYIATELDQDRPAYRHFPAYLTIEGLKKSERRDIALFRIQAGVLPLRRPEKQLGRGPLQVRSVTGTALGSG